MCGVGGIGPGCRSMLWSWVVFLSSMVSGRSMRGGISSSVSSWFEVSVIGELSMNEDG